MNQNKPHRKESLGFPSPLLGETNLRLEILAQNEHFIALNKPALVSVRQHPWEVHMPNLDTCLNKQLQEGKPELLATGAQMFGSVYFLEHSVSGVVVFGKDRDSIADLRNVYGSGAMHFSYYFVALSNGVSGDDFEDNTPLLKHRYKSKMIPSTAKGKQSATQFRCLSKNKEGWGLWEARTNFPRPHQIRLHASLSGFEVLGDSLYRGVEAPSYASVGKWKKENDRDKGIFSGLAMHLKSVHWERESVRGIHIEAVFPKAFKAMLSYLNLKISE